MTSLETAIGAVAGALAILAAFGHYARKVVRWAWRMHTIVQQMNETVHRELTPNGGSSTYDTVRKTGTRLANVEEQVAWQRKDVADLAVEVGKIARQVEETDRSLIARVSKIEHEHGQLSVLLDHGEQHGAVFAEGDSVRVTADRRDPPTKENP